MACYSYGQSRDHTPFGRCCRRVVIPYNWCADCDPGVEAVFIPCLAPCTPEAPAEGGTAEGGTQPPVGPEAGN